MATAEASSAESPVATHTPLPGVIGVTAERPPRIEPMSVRDEARLSSRAAS